MFIILERDERKYFIEVGDVETETFQDSYYYENVQKKEMTNWIFAPDVVERISYSLRDNESVKKLFMRKPIGRIFDIPDERETYSSEIYSEKDIVTNIILPEYVLMDCNISDMDKARCIVIANQEFYRVKGYSENVTNNIKEIYEAIKHMIIEFGYSYSKGTIYEEVFNSECIEAINNVNRLLIKNSSKYAVYASIEHKNKRPFYFFYDKNERKKVYIQDILTELIEPLLFEKSNYLNLNKYNIEENFLFGRYKTINELLWAEGIKYQLMGVSEFKAYDYIRLCKWKEAIEEWVEKMYYIDYSYDYFLSQINLAEQMLFLPVKEFSTYWKFKIKEQRNIRVEFCPHEYDLSETVMSWITGNNMVGNTEINPEDVTVCQEKVESTKLFGIINDIWKYDYSTLRGYKEGKIFFLPYLDTCVGLLIEENSEGYNRRRIAISLDIFN